MKAKWKDDEIKQLYTLVETNNQKNKSMLDSFKEFGKLTNRKTLSVRNFYYAFTKILKIDTSLQKKLNIDISKHYIQTFEHFDDVTQSETIAKIQNLKDQGYSTRSACLKLSNGDIKTMLRLQNKFRNVDTKSKTHINSKANQFENSIEVIRFPKKQRDAKNFQGKLSDDDIKSLFLGLVKLVKENATSDSQEKAKKFLEQTEAEKRRKIVEIEQKQFEIERLKETIADLKNKNSTLNKQLENYRIDYLSNHTPQNNQPNIYT